MTNEVPDLPLLVSLKDMVKLFPQRAPRSIYRWNADVAGREKMLPEPALRLTGKPLWTLDQIEAFAADRGLRMDTEHIEQMRREQKPQKSR